MEISIQRSSGMEIQLFEEISMSNSSNNASQAVGLIVAAWMEYLMKKNSDFLDGPEGQYRIIAFAKKLQDELESKN